MLPYQTLEEAALAVGRNLTMAEKVWFNYSAHKSDFLLYSHNVLFLFLVLSSFPLPYAFIELSQSEVMAKFKVQTKIKRSFSDMFKSYTNAVKKYAGIVSPLILVGYPALKEVSSQLVVYLLIEDYTHYWFHRLLHSKWGYEKIHYMHHEYSATIAFAAGYLHWAEFMILGLPTFLGPLLVPCHIITICLWIMLRQVEAIQTHTGYEFPWSPTKLIPFYGGAEYHDYHHYVGGQSQSNFSSVFTYCDRIYGTDKVSNRYFAIK
ncbi:hypothetical protein PTKIN_Ptkin15bG0026900 [Pterospermum kingtungense]